MMKTTTTTTATTTTTSTTTTTILKTTATMKTIKAMKMTDKDNGIDDGLNYCSLCHFHSVVDGNDELVDNNYFYRIVIYTNGIVV